MTARQGPSLGFGRKRISCGISHNTWQRWLVAVVFIIVVLVVAK